MEGLNFSIVSHNSDRLTFSVLGFAVFASVQAYLKQPLYFPGDYVAWDKEFCMSSAMLNAYLEEWAVLTPDAANQAFNVQDGTNFTWGKKLSDARLRRMLTMVSFLNPGRFWPYLAHWYGTSWTPPESDPDKYRTFTSRATETPRGYVQPPCHETRAAILMESFC